MSDAGLDAGTSFFISTTWWEAERTVPAVEANEAKMIEAKEEHTVIIIMYNQKHQKVQQNVTEKVFVTLSYCHLLVQQQSKD